MTEYKSEKYKTIDNLPEYIQGLLDRGANVVLAEKTGKIAARPGVIGERVISWSVDAEGNPVLEKDATVSADAAGIPGWVVTKIDDNGKEVIDSNGHNNCWIIDNEVFCRKYVEDTECPGVYKPAGGIQKFVKLDEAIHILQWGEEWNVDRGGYINITNPEDMYVISGRDFGDIYRIIVSVK